MREIAATFAAKVVEHAYPCMLKPFTYEPDAKPTEIESLCKAFGIRRHPDTLFTVIGPYGLLSLSMESKRSGVVQVST